MKCEFIIDVDEDVECDSMATHRDETTGLLICNEHKKELARKDTPSPYRTTFTKLK